MATSFLKRIQNPNTKLIMTLGLLLMMLLYLIFAISAYRSSRREHIVGGIMASSIFGLVLSLVTLCAVRRDNYFIVYLFFVFTSIQIALGVLLALSFPRLAFLIMLQIFLVIVAFVHKNKIKEWRYLKSMKTIEMTSPVRIENEYEIEDLAANQEKN